MHYDGKGFLRVPSHLRDPESKLHSERVGVKIIGVGIKHGSSLVMNESRDKITDSYPTRVWCSA